MGVLVVIVTEFHSYCGTAGQLLGLGERSWEASGGLCGVN
jgi:hypothetical protein